MAKILQSLLQKTTFSGNGTAILQNNSFKFSVNTEICKKYYKYNNDTVCLSARNLNIFKVLKCFNHTGNDKEDKWWIKWDGNIDPGDATDQAFSERDIMKLKPHPEYRNVATGPIFGEDAYEKLWTNSKDYLMKEKEEQDEAWDSYIQEFNISPEEYFVSRDYQSLYENQRIWDNYKRNFKGDIQPQKTRRYCIKKGEIATGSPCPLCRDEKVKIIYKNKALLLQFIDPLSQEIYHELRTGVCRRKQTILERTIFLARNFGILPLSLDPVEHDLNTYRLDHPAVSSVTESYKR